jgi:hypothetical protein
MLNLKFNIKNNNVYSSGKSRVLVYGAGDAGEQLASEL